MRISLATPKVGTLCRSQVGSVRAVCDTFQPSFVICRAGVTTTLLAWTAFLIDSKVDAGNTSFGNTDCKLLRRMV